MNWLRSIQSRLRALFRKRKLDADMDDEMRSHIELRTQANIEAGMNPEEARFAALRQFGWTESIKEDCREQRGVRWLENLLRDLRYGARQLHKNPGFTTVAVLTLALGIGANSAIFSVIDSVLLRPLPYPDSERLVWLAERGTDWEGGPISYPNFEDWREQQSVFERVGVFNWNNFVLTGRGDPVHLLGVQISADSFAALQVQPILGRTFAPEEDLPGAQPVAMLSHPVWQSQFGGDPSILNRTIELNDRAHTVVGIMPAGFAYPAESVVWVPVGPVAAETGWREERGTRPGLYGVARLKSGVTLEQARAAMDTIAARLEQQYPASNQSRRVQLETLIDSQVGHVRRGLWILLGAVGLLLAIACANVANLLLARAAARRKEMTVRVALGAGRWQIVRQLLTESVLLSALGGLAGLFLATGLLRVIPVWAADSIPRAADVGLNAGVLVFSGFVVLLAGVFFGLAPAWQSSRPDLQSTLKDLARGTTGGQSRFRHGLVVSEVALTLLLLVGAGLLLRSFHRLQQVKAGFEGDGVVSFQVNLPERKYPDPDRQAAFFRDLSERLRALPGVEAAAVTSRIPLEGNDWSTEFFIDGRPAPPPGELPSMAVQTVGPDYFTAMRIPVLRGRVFTERDNREHVRGGALEREEGGGLNAIVIDEEFAERHWPGSDPIGQRIRLDWAPDYSPAMTVVGVVGRVKWRQLNERGEKVQAYLPYLQLPFSTMTVVLRTALAPDAVIPAARRQVLEIDPEQPVYNIRSLSAMRDRGLAPQRLNFTLLALFALVALSLAVVGLYGVLAFSVARRRREIGVRMALGARREDVLRLVIGHGMRLALAGTLAGLLGAFALTRVLATLLFEVNPNDPATFIAVPVLLVAVALIACWLPARRAARVNPMEALRAE
jgi:predicted permease